MFEDWQQKLQALQFSRKQQQAFLEDVSTLIGDGVPANQAVSAVAQIAKGQVKKVAQQILRKISEGRLIADGMQGWFPQAVVEIVRAGEEGGTLAGNMKAAARAVIHKSRGISALINALVYPAAVIILGLIVAVFVKHSVLTNFMAMKPFAQWPEDGKILYTVATFVESWWWLLIIMIVGVLFAIAQLLSQLTGEVREVIDKLPLFSLYRDSSAARLMETLGMLLANGIILKRGLAIMRLKANRYLQWHIYKMELRLSGGRENIAEVLDTGLIGQADMLRLRVIAKGKGFEHALLRAGQLAAEHTTKKVELISKVAGFALLFMGALWAAFMILSIYGVGSFVAGA